MNSQNDTTLHHKTKKHVLTDTNQSFWQLSAIQLAQITSLPVIVSSIILVRETSLFNSIVVLIVANLILWGIRYYLIVMSSVGRKSVMDIAKDYFGRVWFFGTFGVHLVAILLLLTTMAFFVEETTLVSNALITLFPLNEGPDVNPFMQMSVLIGIVSTIFCAWGMVALRRLSIIALPFILIGLGILIFTPLMHFTFISHKSFSLAGLPKVLAINLAVTADLPTFFRHSRSWKNSIKALTTVQILGLCIGIAGLFLGAVIHPSSGMPMSNIISAGMLSKLAFVVLIAFSGVCTNVSNVYAASVGWEIFAPSSLVGKKEYLILGFLLTLFYLIIVGLTPIDTFVGLTSDSLVNLSLVFVIGFFISKFIKPLGRFDQSTLFLTWLISTALIVFQYAGFFIFASTLVASIIVIPILICVAYGLRFCFAGVLARKK